VGNHQLKFRAPTNGRLMDLSMHPDEVIRQQLLGPGFLIQVHGNELQAPISGTLTAASPSGHQWMLESNTAKPHRCLLVFASPQHLTHISGLQKVPRLKPEIRAGQRLAKLHLPDMQAQVGHRFLAVVFPQLEALELHWPAPQISLGDEALINLSYP